MGNKGKEVIGEEAREGLWKGRIGRAGKGEKGEGEYVWNICPALSKYSQRRGTLPRGSYRRRRGFSAPIRWLVCRDETSVNSLRIMQYEGWREMREGEKGCMGRKEERG